MKGKDLYFHLCFLLEFLYARCEMGLMKWAEILVHDHDMCVCVQCTHLCDRAQFYGLVGANQFCWLEGTAAIILQPFYYYCHQHTTTYLFVCALQAGLFVDFCYLWNDKLISWHLPHVSLQKVEMKMLLAVPSAPSVVVGDNYARYLSCLSAPANCCDYLHCILGEITIPVALECSSKVLCTSPGLISSVVKTDFHMLSTNLRKMWLISLNSLLITHFLNAPLFCLVKLWMFSQFFPLSLTQPIRQSCVQPSSPLVSSADIFMY